MFIFEAPVFQSIIAGYKPLLFAGIVVTGVAYTLQLFGYKAVKPVLATLILSSEAVFAVLGGIILLGETLNFSEMLGCLIMTLGIVLAQIEPKQKTTHKILKHPQRFARLSNDNVYKAHSTEFCR